MRDKVSAVHVQFMEVDLTREWPFETESFDFACCNLVLEHLSKLDRFFSLAFRVLRAGGLLYVCEYHPFKQYIGKQAKFEDGGEEILVDAFVHHLSEYRNSALTAGFKLVDVNEFWHPEEESSQVPRLIRFVFNK